MFKLKSSNANLTNRYDTLRKIKKRVQVAAEGKIMDKVSLRDVLYNRIEIRELLY